MSEESELEELRRQIAALRKVEAQWEIFLTRQRETQARHAPGAAAPRHGARRQAGTSPHRLAHTAARGGGGGRALSVGKILPFGRRMARGKGWGARAARSCGGNRRSGLRSVSRAGARFTGSRLTAVPGSEPTIARPGRHGRPDSTRSLMNSPPPGVSTVAANPRALPSTSRQIVVSHRLGPLVSPSALASPTRHGPGHASIA